LGAYLGEAYQVADDIRDVIADAATLGKPAGQDALHARPSSAQALGLDGAIAHFDHLIEQAASSIPACSCRDMLRQLVQLEAERLVPKALCEGYFKTHPAVAPVRIGAAH
jgi:geranylgeranyl diphosphate synthase type II